MATSTTKKPKSPKMVFGELLSIVRDARVVLTGSEALGINS